MISVTIFPLHFSVLTQNNCYHPTGRYIATVNESFEPNCGKVLYLWSSSRNSALQRAKGKVVWQGAIPASCTQPGKMASRGKAGPGAQEPAAHTAEGLQVQAAHTLLGVLKMHECCWGQTEGGRKEGNIFWCVKYERTKLFDSVPVHLAEPEILWGLETDVPLKTNYTEA